MALDFSRLSSSLMVEKRIGEEWDGVWRAEQFTWGVKQDLERFGGLGLEGCSVCTQPGGCCCARSRAHRAHLCRYHTHCSAQPHQEQQPLVLPHLVLEVCEESLGDYLVTARAGRG